MKPYDWMRVAIVDASKATRPFGAIIVKDDKLISRGVPDESDPTGHAEMVAIRSACRVLGTRKLQDCVMYCTCEPCPMCLAAIFQVKLSGLYFAASRKDAEALGFKYVTIYDYLKVAPRTKWPIPTNPAWASWRARNEAITMMKRWKDGPVA